MNYDELVATSIAYADRQDIEVTQQMDIFIIMVESQINRLLKTREQSARAIAPSAADQEYYCLPSDFAGMRDIQVNSTLALNSDYAISQYHYLSPEQMNAKKGATVDKNYYTIIADQLQIYPVLPAGCSIEMVYYQRVPNLNAAAPNNWLSDSHPDIYVAGMTAEIELFAKNYEAADGWKGRVVSSINELDVADDLERWSGQALVTRAG